jgi:ribonuclease P protein component
MLPRRHRLSLRKDADAIYREGKRIQGKYFALIVAEQKEKSNTKIAVVVSRKAAKLAVERNRLRRRATQAIRLHLNELENGYNIICTAGKASGNASFDQLHESILSDLKNAGVVMEK